MYDVVYSVDISFFFFEVTISNTYFMLKNSSSPDFTHIIRLSNVYLKYIMKKKTLHGVILNRYSNKYI